jgi:exodeoxyribonuclease VII large subunit
MDSRLRLSAGHLRELLKSYALGRIRSRIEAAMQSLDYQLDTLCRTIIEAGRRRRASLSEITARLEALNPRAILSRGYTICSDIASGEVIRSATAAAGREEMRVSFFDGSLRAEIKERLDGQD